MSIDTTQEMSILVAIASYGKSQDHYLTQVVSEFRKIGAKTRIVVLSNEWKEVPGAEIAVGLPSPNPYSLPFAHRKLFFDNMDRYDLFIYAEDDTLITAQHVQSFLKAQKSLKEDEIAGFVRSETDPEGRKFITSIHHHFRWLPESVVERGGEVFAALSNQHSGCFIVTRDQLRKAVASGGFVVAPHSGRYGMLESAASDLYTQCGLRRLICLTRSSDFIVAHLPNKYYRHMGIPIDELHLQIQRLREVYENQEWTGKLFESSSNIPEFRWSIDLYARPDEELLRAIPPESRSVLSIGSGMGENEASLVRRGMDVCAVPMDGVFTASLNSRGVRTVTGPLDEALQSLSGNHFDTILLANVLHLVEDPALWLDKIASLLEPQGRIIASVPNTGDVVEWTKDWASGLKRGILPNLREHGVQGVTGLRLRRWCKAAGLQMENLLTLAEGPRREKLGMIKALIPTKFVMTAKRAESN